MNVHLEGKVIRFSELMYERLEANDDKGGWDGLLFTSLFDRLEGEVIELKDAVIDGDPDHVLREAADVANYALMIADNFLHRQWKDGDNLPKIEPPKHEHKFELRNYMAPGMPDAVFYCEGCDRYMYVVVAMQYINRHADETNTWTKR